MSEIELEPISYTEKHFFVEKVMRGGISSIAKRYGKSINNYMQSYNANKPSKFIAYMDSNNFYGWVISRYLPYSRFKWLSQKESVKCCLNSIECNFIEKIVLMDRVEKLILNIIIINMHYIIINMHYNYPLAPEKLKISHNMLSN